jgi:hypothetical protein
MLDFRPTQGTQGNTPTMSYYSVNGLGIIPSATTVAPALTSSVNGASDANIGIVFAASGTGNTQSGTTNAGFTFNTAATGPAPLGTKTQFQVVHTGGTIKNWITVTGAATGSPAQIGLNTTSDATGAIQVTAPGGLQSTTGIVAVNATAPYTNFTTLVVPSAGTTAPVIPATATNSGNNAAYWSQIFIPYNVTLTGACWTNAATVTTDKRQVVLWNSAGTVLANSAAAGVADSGNANKLQCTTFSPGTVAVTGPASYFVGFVVNGSTDTFMTYQTGGAPTGYTGGAPTGYITGTAANTFGTPTAITAGSTFNTAVGPLMVVF